ncbi:MAG: Bro-N domain-containing protein [Bacteroidota bacterium]
MEILNFGNYDIRTIDHAGQTWYSVIDIVGAITDSTNPSAYWRKLRSRLDDEGSEVVTDCHKLKLEASDGKRYATDCATRETLLRLIQSIPSPSVEPFKMWLANAGEQNMQETENPELLISKVYDHYRDKGMNDDWIDARIRSMNVRNSLTQRWQAAGITSNKEYAFLTNIISKGTFDLTVAEHKKIKGLARKHNIRDNMSTLELIYIILAEVTAKELSEKHDAQGYRENEDVARQAGYIAGESRKRFESKTGLNVVTSSNALDKED